LKLFLDWLLEPRQWPRKDAHPHPEAFRLWEKTRKVRLALEALSQTCPQYTLTEAVRLVNEVEKSYETAKQSTSYTTPRSRIVCGPRVGNIEYQRRIFVAKLILQKFRESKVYRKQLCPKKDGFTNMAGYIAEKDQESFREAYDSVKQTYYRYLRKRDELAPLAVVHSLYGMYLWQTKGKCWVSTPKDFQRLIARGIKPGSIHNPHHSEEERQMLRSLAQLASPIALRSARQENNRSHLGGVEDLPLNLV